MLCFYVCFQFNKAGHSGYETFIMLNSTEHVNNRVQNVKITTIVGISAFIRRVNTTFESLKHEKSLFSAF